MAQNDTTPQKGGKAVGIIIVAASLGFGAFVFAHRPPTGIGDLFERGGSFFFEERMYYVLLALAGLLGASGLIRLTK